MAITPLQIREMTLGKGRPKIAVPIMGRDLTELLEQAEQAMAAPCDIIEWRLDWFQRVFQPEAVREAGRALRDVLGDLPLLATFRTHKEGGVLEAETRQYAQLIRQLAQEQLADLVDIEAFTGDELVRELIGLCHQNQVLVVLSNHDFHQTPPHQEILSRLQKMEELGGDVSKIAVMPQSAGDVLVLLGATWEMTSRYAKKPVITMSMGRLGAVSRIAGETFGSALTFGTAGKSSAPGQLEADELIGMLKLLRQQ